MDVNRHNKSYKAELFAIYLREKGVWSAKVTEQTERILRKAR